MLTFGGPQEPGTPVRARRPPGGASSISLAWGDEQDAHRQPARSSANAFAHGARQNTQNVMTDKPTTRIKAPPGGRSSISLAWEEPADCGNQVARTPPRTPQSSSRAGAYNEEFERASRKQWARPSPLDDDEEDEEAEAASWVQNARQKARDYRSSAFDGHDLGMTPKSRCRGSGSELGGYSIATSEEQSAADWNRGNRSQASGQWQEGCHAEREYRCDDAFSRASMQSDYSQRTPKAASRYEGRSEAFYCPDGPRTPKANAGDGGMARSHHPKSSDSGASHAMSRTPKAACRDELTPVARRSSQASDSNVGSRTPRSQARDDFGRCPQQRGGCNSEVSNSNVTPRSSARGGLEAPFGQRAQRQSANAYAQGSNQNCGNMLTEVPTTRVCAPPGGHSSIQLGGDDAIPQPRATPRGSSDSHPRDVTPRRSSVASGSGEAFGNTPKRTSSNAFARGNNPNSGNMLTERPTSRVSAPPGGKSSIAFGWDYDSSCAEPKESTTPRTPKSGSHSEVSRGTAQRGKDREQYGAYSSAFNEDKVEDVHELASSCSNPYLAYHKTAQLDDRAGKPTVDINELRNLKSRMSRRSTAGSTADSGSHIYDQRHGYGECGSSQMSRCSSAPGLQKAGKDDVEGSRPRKWKPAKAPRAPPGGNPTFHPARDGQRDEVAGRKRFPDMGAGSNRDANAIEALRYYQDCERLGKHSGAKNTPATTKHIRDSHRYYLAAEGKADLTPGKSRHGPTSQQSTSACSSECHNSECDSLPLGAEWSSCRFESARGECFPA
jgi:hypothetical protein